MYQDRIEKLAGLPANRRRRLKAFYDRAALRLDGTWPGTGYSGEEYREPDHLYQDDLSVLGTGSLFEYIATARTEVGRRRLAQYLLHPATAEEARARQAAVQELRDLPDLRERVATLGPSHFEDCDANALYAWLDAPPVKFPAWLPPVALATSATLLVIVIIALIALVPWREALPYMAIIAGFHILVAQALRERVKPRLKSGFELAPEIAILSEGLSLLVEQSFQAPKLRELQQRAVPLPARLRALVRLTHWCREREKEWFYGPAMYLFIGTQLAMALERWRSRHAADLREAVDIWAEFEALQALGTYAHEHRNDIYPEFTDTCHYDAEGLGHPMLQEDICIRNDVHFGDDCRFWVISGSNMAGKSTLLRSIGMSVVLGLAGAPVRATRLTLAPLRLCASIGVPDSLLDGKSRFRSEVDRIRDSIAAASQAPALFLIDEIFSGTNSHDRRIAAEAVVRTLLSHGAIGALSTHDLALTEIATFPGLAGENVHMCSRTDDAALDFDYRLKPGVNRQSNALAIARLAGVPV